MKVKMLWSLPLRPRDQRKYNRLAVAAGLRAFLHTPKSKSALFVDPVSEASRSTSVSSSQLAVEQTLCVKCEKMLLRYTRNSPTSASSKDPLGQHAWLNQELYRLTIYWARDGNWSCSRGITMAQVVRYCLQSRKHWARETNRVQIRISLWQWKFTFILQDNIVAWAAGWISG